MNLIFDVSNIYHRSYSIVSNYKNFNIEEDKWNQILLRKFFIDVSSIINKFEVEKIKTIYFAFDSQSWRKEYSDTYKSNRVSKHENFYKILDNIYKILKLKNFNAIKIDNLEADDIIMLITKFESNFDNIIISNDRDLLQLVTEKTFVFTSNSLAYKCFCKSIRDLKNYPELITISKEINPQFCLFEKILLGDESDNIDRILPKGMGPKKVQQFYSEFITFDHSIYEFLKNKNISVEEQRVELQIKLIQLDKEHFPKDSIKLFNEVWCFANTLNKKITIEDFLSDTQYIN